MTIFTNNDIKHEAVMELTPSFTEATSRLEQCGIIDELRSEYFGWLEDYGDTVNLREQNRLYNPAEEKQADISVKAARARVVVASVTAITSIQTDTARLQWLEKELREGNITPSDMVRKSTDGRVKTEKFTNQFDVSGKIVSGATRCLLNGKPDEARRYLIGRRTRSDDGTIQSDETYLRNTKANFVLWLLGYRTHCVDTRVIDTLHKPDADGMRLIDALFNTDAGPYARRHLVNKSYTRQDQVPLFIDEARNREGYTFWWDVLKWCPPIYDYLTSFISECIAHITEIPEDRVFHTMFRMQGEEDKVHEALRFIGDFG